MWNKADLIIIEGEIRGELNPNDPNYVQRVIDWSDLPDPKDLDDSELQKVFDEIRNRVDDQLGPLIVSKRDPNRTYQRN